MNKRIISLLLCLVMIFTYGICLADNTVSETTIAEKALSENKVEKITDEPVTLTLWCDITNNGAIGVIIDKMNDMDLLQTMEEKTGVHLECINPPIGESETAFSLMLASGDYPDIIMGFINYYPYSGDTAIDEGIICDLTDLVEQYAPNYKAAMNASEFRALGAVTDQGNMPYIYKFYYMDEPQPNVGGTIIRQDLLDKLGMEMPDTYDELHEFLLRCKNELGLKRALALDSNGSSKYDGLTAGFGMHLSNATVETAFYRVDDQIIYAPLTDGYRNYITMLAQWYSEGLVDPDFASVVTFDDGLAMVTSGECAVSSDYGGILDMYNSMGQAAVADFNFVVAPTTVQNEGDMVHIGSSTGRDMTAVAVITTSCEYPEIAMQYIDQFYSDEGFILTNYGTEGKTYETVDGIPVINDLIFNNPLGTPTDAMCAYVTPQTWFQELVVGRDITTETREKFKTWDVSNDNAGVIPASVTLNSEEKETYGDLYSEIKSYVDEMTVRFIMGLEPLENYDKFVEQLHNMGVDDAIASYQSAYDRYLNR